MKPYIFLTLLLGTLLALGQARWRDLTVAPGGGGGTGNVVASGTSDVGWLLTASTNDGIHGVWKDGGWFTYSPGNDRDTNAILITSSTTHLRTGGDDGGPVTITNAVQFGINQLEEFLWGPGVSANFGAPSSDLANDLLSNSDTWNFGDFAGWKRVVTNSYAVYNFGNVCGQLANLNTVQNFFNFGDGCGYNLHATNSGPMFNYGDGAGTGASTILSDVHDCFNYGDGPGSLSQWYASSEIYMNGYLSGQNSVLNNCSSFHVYGDQAAHSLHATNSSVLHIFGGLKNAVLNDTKELSTFGQGAGDNLSGAFTNLVLVADGAIPQGTNAQDQVIIGPRMSLLFTSGYSGFQGIPEATDMEGGPIYSIQSVGPFVSGTFQLAQNYLTNFNNDIGTVQTFCYPAVDAASLASSNAAVTLFGNYTFFQSTASHCYSIVGLVDASLYECTLTNCVQIVGAGNQTFSGAKLTNSTAVYAVGDGAGNHIAGSYSEIYLWGHNAQPTLTANQQVFGGGSDNYLFAGTGGLGTKGTGTITTSATGATNTLNANVVIYVTAATGASLTDNAGTTEFSGVSIAAFTPVRLQPGGKFVATGVTYATGTASHAW